MCLLKRRPKYDPIDFLSLLCNAKINRWIMPKCGLLLSFPSNCLKWTITYWVKNSPNLVTLAEPPSHTQKTYKWKVNLRREPDCRSLAFPAPSGFRKWRRAIWKRFKPVLPDFLGTLYQNRKNVLNEHQMYQMNTKCSKWTPNVPNEH
jgi:hypothetical protein